MKRNDILFWIALLGFFGINGLDLLNYLDQFVSDLVFKYGNIVWVMIIGGIYLYLNREK